MKRVSQDSYIQRQNSDSDEDFPQNSRRRSIIRTLPAKKNMAPLSSREGTMADFGIKNEPFVETERVSAHFGIESPISTRSSEHRRHEKDKKQSTEKRHSHTSKKDSQKSRKKKIDLLVAPTGIPTDSTTTVSGISDGLSRDVSLRDSSSRPSVSPAPSREVSKQSVRTSVSSLPLKKMDGQQRVSGTSSSPVSLMSGSHFRTSEASLLSGKRHGKKKTSSDDELLQPKDAIASRPVDLHSLTEDTRKSYRSNGKSKHHHHHGRKSTEHADKMSPKSNDPDRKSSKSDAKGSRKSTTSTTKRNRKNKEMTSNDLLKDLNGMGDDSPDSIKRSKSEQFDVSSIKSRRSRKTAGTADNVRRPSETRKSKSKKSSTVRARKTIDDIMNSRYSDLNITQQTQNTEDLERRTLVDHGVDHVNSNISSVGLGSVLMDGQTIRPPVTIFQHTGCPFAMKIMKEFDDAGCEYKCINLSKYPNHTILMKNACGKIATPQIFVGDTHLGCFQQSMNVIQAKSSNSHLIEHLYEHVLGKRDYNEPMPVSQIAHQLAPRRDVLDLPKEHTAVPIEEPLIDLGAGVYQSLTAITMEALLKEQTFLPERDRTMPEVVSKETSNKKIIRQNSGFKGILKFKNPFKKEEKEPEEFLNAPKILVKPFTQKELCTILSEELTLSSGYAQNVIKKLMKLRILIPVSINGEQLEIYSDTTDYYLQVSSFTDPVLNQEPLTTSFQKGCKLGKDPFTTLKEASLLLHTLKSEMSQFDGNLTLKTNTTEYLEFKNIICKLEDINIMKLYTSQQMATVFYIQLYHLMVEHGYVEFGRHVMERSAGRPYFEYLVGGYYLSLDDIVGILRSNKTNLDGNIPFYSHDVRKILCLKKFDPRTHFALVSPEPNFRIVESDTLNEKLERCTTNFIREKGNFKIDKKHNEIRLHAIFEYYFFDISQQNGSTKQREILTFIQKYAVLGSELHTQVTDLIVTGKSCYLYYLHK